VNRVYLIILVFSILSCQSYGEDRAVSPTIQEVNAKYGERLLAMPGVVSVGISKNPDGQFVIVVGLDGPRPKTIEQIPKVLEGYPIRVEIIGPVKAR
jgi:hypothetical protein